MNFIIKNYTILMLLSFSLLTSFSIAKLINEEALTNAIKKIDRKLVYLLLSEGSLPDKTTQTALIEVAEKSIEKCIDVRVRTMTKKDLTIFLTGFGIAAYGVGILGKMGGLEWIAEDLYNTQTTIWNSQYLKDTKKELEEYRTNRAYYLKKSLALLAVGSSIWIHRGCKTTTANYYLEEARQIKIVIQQAFTSSNDT